MKNRMRMTAVAAGFCVFLSACAKAPAGTPDTRADAAGNAYTEIVETEAETAEKEATFASRVEGTWSARSEEEFYTLELFDVGGNLYGYVGEGEDTYSYWAMEIIPEEAGELLDPDTESAVVGVLCYSDMSNLAHYWSSPKMCKMTLTPGALVFAGIDGENQPVTMDSKEISFVPDDTVEGTFPYTAGDMEKKTDPALNGLWKETGSEEPRFLWFMEDGSFQTYQKKRGTEARLGKGSYSVPEQGSFKAEYSLIAYGGMPVEEAMNYTLEGESLIVTGEWAQLPALEDSQICGRVTFERAKENEIPVVCLAEPDDTKAVRGETWTISQGNTERTVIPQFLSTTDIENNGGTFLRLGDLVYFRTYDPQEEVAGTFGQFMNEQSMAENAKVCYYDQTSGETGIAFSCEATGPLWYVDGRFYSTMTDGGIHRFWPDGSGEEVFLSTEYASVADASSDNRLLAIHDYTNEFVGLCDGTYMGASFYRSGEDTLFYTGFAGDTLLAEVREGGRDENALYAFKEDGSETLLGDLPNSEWGGWTTPEVEQVERIGDQVYVGLAWYDGTMIQLSDYAVVTADLNTENSLRVLMHNIPDTWGEGDGAPWFAVVGDENLEYMHHDPNGEIALSEKTWGDLSRFEGEDQETVLVPDLIPEYPFDKEEGEQTTCLQAAELAGSDIFYILTDIKRSQAEDIGWREGYTLEAIHFWHAGIFAGDPEEFTVGE